MPLLGICTQVGSKHDNKSKVKQKRFLPIKISASIGQSKKNPSILMLNNKFATLAHYVPLRYCFI
jgi:hypothetical protein